MTTETSVADRALLSNWIMTVYGGTSEPLSRRDFLRESWQAMASLVRYNKENPLVTAAVRRYPDLIPRAFVILSVLYGLYSSPPSKLGIVKDFAGMLDGDLDENETRVRAYAKIRRGGTFFSKLSRIWEIIRTIYSPEHRIPGALPPTPYHAYALYVLNNPELLEQDISQEELFSRLVAHHSKMGEIAELAKPSGVRESVESSEGHTLH